ncbi:hypothetical protein EMPS_01273 [Entomortierella parvispora]|uniref:Uncharacterized protein n=1 Tax=Entomortierella parvispora TaxID=205924 RepID=A0A9P3H391_9FUNG|nr:hypothetical protein EMPS_01273 [Entomortierella parvispora]
MQSPRRSFDEHSSTPSPPRPRSLRPGSAIWTQLSHPTTASDHGRLRSGFDNQPKSRSSFVNMPATIDLKDGLFVGKSRQAWSAPKLRRQWRRQPRTLRLALTLMSGFTCLCMVWYLGSAPVSHLGHRFQSGRTDSRQARAKSIVCDPRITHALPLPPKILSNGTHSFDPTLIVVSFDGMRAEYLTRGLTPNINSVGANGIAAEYMQSSFPTLTFPNHYSMVTGLYPSNHGIVANMFYDPELKDDFNYRIPDKSWDPKWWGGEPIWEAAVRQKQRSGVIMWPGGESLRPVRPTYHVRYRSNVAAAEKMGTLLEWLDKPREERPTLMNVYISEVDTEGHNFGPDGRRCQKALSEVDNALGALLEGLKARNLDQVVNLMVVSDHGMSYVTPEKSIYYDDYIDTSDLLLEESLQPHLGIRTLNTKRLVSLYKTLKQVQAKKKLPFQVYWREDVPARFHYADNPRIAPLVVIADPGYVMTRRDMGLSVVGVHGWDNQMQDMRAVFAAQGPAFPHQGPEPLQAFENVELHDIMARTIGLRVKDGSTDGVRNGWVSRPC